MFWVHKECKKDPDDLKKKLFWGLISITDKETSQEPEYQFTWGF